jgi:sugar (pentulose or hexulose) kinase
MSLVDERFGTVATTKEPYDYIVTGGDFVEIRPDDILGAFAAGVKKLGPRVSETKALAFDTFSPSLVFLDADGKPKSNVVTHLDRRARAQTRFIMQEFGGERFRKITGVLPFTGGVTLTTILWFKKNRPEIFRDSTIACLVTYMFSFFTGQRAWDLVNASMAGMFDTFRSSGWSKEILSFAGIPRAMLPDVAAPGELKAGLCAGAAGFSGLKAGIPVFLGTNDCAISQIGAGNSRSGDMLNIAGSSEMLSVLTNKPLLHEKYYLRLSATKGLWQIFCITNAGFNLDWFHREFCHELSDKEFFEGYMPRVTEAGSLAKTARFLPYLSGDRHSLKKKRGAFTGLSLDTGRDEVFAALLRGINEPILTTLAICGEKMKLGKKIKITGGLAVNPAYMRLKRQLYENFEFELQDDCAVLGNARLAYERL